MVKRVLLGLLLGLLIAANVFGKGKIEVKGPFVDYLQGISGPNSSRKRTLEIEEEKGIGSTRYKFTSNISGVYGYKLYYMINNYIYRIDAGDKITNTDDTINEETSSEIRQLFSRIENTGTSSPVSFIKGGRLEGEYTNKFEIINYDITENIDKKTYQIVIPHYANDLIQLRVLLMYKLDQNNPAAWFCEFFKTDFTMENFEGEKEILDKLGTTYSENTKKFMIMKELLFKEVLLNPEGQTPDQYNIEIANILTDIARKFGVIGADKDITSLDSITDQSIYDALIYAKYNFLLTINNSLKFIEEKVKVGSRTDTFPYLYINENDLKLIYGKKENRNIYLATLLYLYYKKQKPLLEYLIRTRLYDINYNYNEYKAIKDVDGDALAEAAAKYLTWGVEYTPVNITDNIDLDTNKNEVFKEFANIKDNNDIIDNWLNKPVLENLTPVQLLHLQQNNYLPITPEIITDKIFNFENTVPKRMQELKLDITTNEINLTAKLNKDFPNISRIDIWNSYNLAWESNKIDDVIARKNGVDIIQNKWRINDKHIFLEKKDANNQMRIAADTEIKNFHIPRENYGEKIEVGYKFKNSEKVGALLAVRGFSSEYKLLNLANAKTARALLSIDKSSPSSVTDGKRASAWKSTNKNNKTPYTWIEIDLGAAYLLDYIILHWDDEDYAVKYKIELYYENKKEWKTHIIKSNGAGGIEKFSLQNESRYKLPDTLPPYLPTLDEMTTSRRVRIWCDAASASGKYALKEVEIYKKGIIPDDPVKIMFSTSPGDCSRSQYFIHHSRVNLTRKN